MPLEFFLDFLPDSFGRFSVFSNFFFSTKASFWTFFKIIQKLEIIDKADIYQKRKINH